MKLKKVNAAAGLLAMLLMLVHIGYTVYCYLTFYYNAELKLLSAVPFIVVACVHAFCSMVILFTLPDGTRTDLYPKKNRRTILQRVSSALILPFLFLHINTFQLIQTTAAGGKWFWFALILVSQTLFYGTVILHVSLSFSRALITLGWLSTPKAQKNADRILMIFGIIVFALASWAIIKGEIAMIPMFQSAGGAS